MQVTSCIQFFFYHSTHCARFGIRLKIKIIQRFITRFWPQWLHICIKIHTQKSNNNKNDWCFRLLAIDVRCSVVRLLYSRWRHQMLHFFIRWWTATQKPKHMNEWIVLHENYSQIIHIRWHVEWSNKCWTIQIHILMCDI